MAENDDAVTSGQVEGSEEEAMELLKYCREKYKNKGEKK